MTHIGDLHVAHWIAQAFVVTFESQLLTEAASCKHQQWVERGRNERPLLAVLLKKSIRPYGLIID